MKVAYLSGGSLYFKEKDKPAREIESKFGQELIRNALQIAQKREWKTKGTGAMFMSGGMLWGINDRDAQLRRVSVSAVTARPGTSTLFFALESEAIGGILEYDVDNGLEKRLFHREHFRCADLTCHPVEPWIACSIQFQNGTSNIAVMSDDGAEMNELTEGDSVDEAPFWVPGRNQLLFQTAGVARSAEGYPRGRGACSLARLDLDSGELEMLAEDPAFDFLTPQMTACGDLLYLRRPHEAGFRYPFWRMLLDIVLLPFRLVWAVLSYLNFFSLIYTRKPLTPAGGPKMEGADLRQLVLRGRTIEANRALRGTKDPETGLVPKSWELRRRTPDGAEQTLARGVVCFDLAADGSIVYSNGASLFVLDPAGKRQKLADAPLAQTVLALS